MQPAGSTKTEHRAGFSRHSFRVGFQVVQHVRTKPKALLVIATFGMRFPILDRTMTTLQALKAHALVRTRTTARAEGMTPLQTKQIYVDHARSEIVVYLTVETPVFTTAPIFEAEE